MLPLDDPPTDHVSPLVERLSDRFLLPVRRYSAVHFVFDIPDQLPQFPFRERPVGLCQKFRVVDLV